MNYFKYNKSFKLIDYKNGYHSLCFLIIKLYTKLMKALDVPKVVLQRNELQKIYKRLMTDKLTPLEVRKMYSTYKALYDGVLEKCRNCT